MLVCCYVIVAMSSVMGHDDRKSVRQLVEVGPIRWRAWLKFSLNSQWDKWLLFVPTLSLISCTST